MDVWNVWNAHRIRKTTSACCPSGWPFILYNTPELYGATDQAQDVNLEDVENCVHHCKILKLPCDKDIYKLAKVYMREDNIESPSGAYEAVTLYRYLLERFETDLSRL